MIRRSLSVPLLALFVTCAIPASASPILYTFTATLTVSKTTEGTGNPGGDPPASPFEDAYWFPTLHHGNTYNTTGWLEYEPGLLIDNGWGNAPSIAFISIEDYIFSIASNLGFNAVDGASTDSVSFFDSLPGVVSGYMPDSFFLGEDAVAHLFNPSGTSVFDGIPPTLDGFTNGTLLFFGSGFYALGGDVVQTRLLWNGTIDSIQRVPEPATLLLLSLGGACALARRFRARPPQ